jgi:predicted dehydrogenase
MLRIGILGAGHFAAAHLQALQQLKDRARVVGYARRDAGRAFPEADAIGAAPISLDEALESGDIDAVAVCVPNHLHRHCTEGALRAGKHVFCEKPLAMTVEDADAVMRAAEESKRVLVVGHLTRHVPAYVKVAEILETGRLGKPRAMYASRMHCGGGRSWRMDPETGGGVVFDLLVHDFDLMNWYLGMWKSGSQEEESLRGPRSVTARGHRHPQGSYDYIAATFSYPNEVIGVAEGGFVFRPPAGLRSTLRVIGERGHIEVNTNDPAAPIRVFEEGVPEQSIRVKLDSLLIDGLVAEYEEFLDAVDGNVRGRLRVRDARNAVACAAAVVCAADTGREVRIP